jgi:predicted DNA-binding transcriptional regulator AlpA
MDEKCEESLLTPKELAQRLSMSLKWVEKHTQEHRIPGQLKVGRVWRYIWIEVQKRMISGQVLLDPIRRKEHH